jgi:phosphoserine phosphatase
MFVATLVAPWDRPALDASLVAHAADALRRAGAGVAAPVTRAPGVAVDLPHDGLTPQQARRALLGALEGQPVDVIVQVASQRSRRLFIADMDSTMITVECIDELADFVGKKPEVAAVTEAAMRGELDFVAALDARVALLKGLPLAAVTECLEQRVLTAFTPGGRALIAALNQAGVRTILVSGGFTLFVEPVGGALGFQVTRSNVLEVADGRLTGTVARPVVTADVKRATLLEHCAQLGLTPAQALAVGDGANDIPMIEAAGLGVAFRAKPKTEAAADASLRHCGLDALLFALALPH